MTTRQSNDTIKVKQSEEIPLDETAIILHTQLDDWEMNDVKQDRHGSHFLINLIGCSSKAGLSSDITAALRVSDGVLIVIDLNKGVCERTKDLLRRTGEERLKPAIMINKVDQYLLDPQADPEKLYQSFLQIIIDVNEILALFESPDLRTIQVDPVEDTVVFGSGLHGWAFTLRQFANRFSAKFHMDREKAQFRLWGDTWFHNGKWIRQKPEKTPRSFVMFVLDPIFKVLDFVIKGQAENLLRFCKGSGIQLTEQEMQLPEKQLLKVIMQKYLPAAANINRMIISRLHSPPTSSKIRVGTIYQGPSKDATASSIRNCDADGSLVFYISRIVPGFDSGRSYAFGRVFSGTIKSGSTVRVVGPKYIPGKKEDLSSDRVVKNVVLVTGRSFDPTDGVPAGGVVGLIGDEQSLFKPGMTLTDSEASYSLKSLDRIPFSLD